MNRLTLTLIAVCSAVSGAQAQTRPLTLQDYYRVEAVNGTAISPDGRTVVYVRSVILEPENRRNSEIWAVPADGSAPPRRLTDPALNSSAPRWSPDGTLLTFTARRRAVKPGESQPEAPGDSVWFLRMNGSNEEPFRIPGVGGPPVFSPDNKWMAFTKAVKLDESVPATPLSDADRLIDERFKGRKYDWMNARFDGRGYLADPRDPHATPPEEVFIVSREGGEARQLTTLGVNARGIAWRPDSSALAFVADTHQRDEYSYDRADLFTISLSGSLTRLTDDGYNHASPTWSASGDAVFALREQSLNQVLAAKQTAGSPSDLYRFPLAGGAPQNLTGRWDFIPGPPQISPDGRFVYFSAGRAGTTHLYRVPAAGGDVEQVTTGDRRLTDVSIAWAVSRIAFSGSSVTLPSEAFTARLDGSEERTLTTVNQALARDVTFRPAERLRFASKDGTPVEGWLMMPASAGTPVPLILANHGGPHGAYGTEFSFYFQLDGREWLRRSVHEPARVHRVRREVPLGDVGRMGRRGLRRRDGRRRPRCSPATPSIPSAWVSPATPTAGSSRTG